MATHSGKLATLSFGGTEVASVGEWSWTLDTANNLAAASNTAGAPIATTGAKDSKGSFSTFGKQPVLWPGVATATLIGDTGHSKVSGGVLITGVKATFDYATGKAIEWTYDFEGNGAVDPDSTSSLTIAAAPTIYGPMGGKFRWQPVVAGSLGTLADLPSPQSAELSFSLPTDAYTGSGGWIYRDYGVPLVGTITVNLKDDAFGAMDTAATQYMPGIEGVIHAYVSTTEYFQIKYGKVRSAGVPVVDAKTGKLTGQAITWDFTAWGLLTAGLNKGTIVAPDNTAYFS